MFDEKEFDKEVAITSIDTELRPLDIIGGLGVRCGINRYGYTIEPGIYSVGSPTKASPVLVTANYKLTFDSLRKELAGLSLWILVLDTKGINVWCAAGKGTFGTKELIYRIKKHRLAEVISHKVIILPQLGASGISAHRVRSEAGFRIIYGPVRASDIPQFINNKFKATDEMREVGFDFKDRIVLTPLEIIASLKYIPIIFAAFLLLNYIRLPESGIARLLNIAFLNSIPYSIALLVGTFVVPILLPYIPFNAFSLKGLCLGIILSSFVISFSGEFLFPQNILVNIANVFLLSAITSMLALNFTGCTTYTSFSGVSKETLKAVPIAAAASIAGLIMLFVGFWIS